MITREADCSVSFPMKIRLHFAEQWGKGAKSFPSLPFGNAPSGISQASLREAMVERALRASPRSHSEMRPLAYRRLHFAKQW